MDSRTLEAFMVKAAMLGRVVLLTFRRSVPRFTMVDDPRLSLREN